LSRLEAELARLRDAVRRQLADHEDRRTALELHISGGATISEDQAAEIAGAVKNVAHLLGQQGIANPYPPLWGELYKR
jgi:hypothetical protein